MHYIQNYWLKFEKSRQDTYIATDSHGDNSAEINQEAYDFLTRLDGKTDPYSIHEWLTKHEVDEILQDLEGLEFVRDRWIMRAEKGRVTIPFWHPKHGKGVKSIAKTLHALVMMVFVPVIIVGLSEFFMEVQAGTVHDLTWPATICGFIMAFMVHGCYKATACVACCDTTREFGLTTMMGIPYLYMVADSEAITNPFIRFHVEYASGVEATLCLGCAGFILESYLTDVVAGFVFSIAVANIYYTFFSIIMSLQFVAYRLDIRAL